ncbi:hypothetical protein AGR13a_Lc60187 [Agrobacterium genomosp. 13 str. CFBP 6927]|uniref:Uncharacterized protein n=1 Tax=Agrobacterium genomosp. 13 str. CFBP 6927 TaxID=1183428 RepID=A0ABM9VMD3_9HYPH|nr:hypothetical protein AGR13a_Lc60187 [Agrobacterium genomosp. 13 str. CFBP 6927]
MENMCILKRGHGKLFLCLTPKETPLLGPPAVGLPFSRDRRLSPPEPEMAKAEARHRHFTAT